VGVFNYQNGPTYRCLIPEQPVQNEVLSCSQVGVIGVLPGIIGSYQALEVIKMITGHGNVLSGKLLIIDTLKPDHIIISVERNEKYARIEKLGEYGSFCNHIPENVKTISVQQLNSVINENHILVFDIRDKRQFDQYHILSVHIEIEELLNNPQILNKEKQIVIVCEKGVKSAAIIEVLQNTNTNLNLYNLDGGIQAWIASNLPLIKPKN